MSSDQHIPPHTAEAPNCVYNLFRNKCLPEIICAVPEDRPVPSFIDAERWSFEQPLRPLDNHPPGFDSSAARTESRFNGFYLFYAFATTPAARSALDIMMGSF